MVDTAAILDLTAGINYADPFPPSPEGGKEGQNNLYGMESEGQARKK